MYGVVEDMEVPVERYQHLSSHLLFVRQPQCHNYNKFICTNLPLLHYTMFLLKSPLCLQDALELQRCSFLTHMNTYEIVVLLNIVFITSVVCHPVSRFVLDASALTRSKRTSFLCIFPSPSSSIHSRSTSPGASLWGRTKSDISLLQWIVSLLVDGLRNEDFHR